jgi:cell fate (sporulation/competence/biofilm development) regulator YlbF (YheA/YmcA/DUF963 family)
MNDWSENIVKLQPLSRSINEKLNRMEYDEAEVDLRELLRAVQELHIYAIKESVKLGCYFG